MTDLQTLRTNLNTQKGRRFQITKTIEENSISLKESKRSLHRNEEAKEIIRTVGQITQQQLSFHISDITSLAMEAVFKEPYQLKIDFVQRRNKTECDLSFERNGVKIDPLTASGGGAVDVAAFALRIASWTMMNPRSRNTIILDEPFRFLSGDNIEKASAMVKEISQKLGIQFLIVSHSETLTSYADRTFTTSIKKGITKISVS